MRLTLKKPAWDQILIVTTVLLITALAPKPESLYFGTFILGYFVACQASVLPDAVAKTSRWFAVLLGILGFISFVQTGDSMQDSPPYIQAFLLGNSGYGFFGAHESFTLFSADFSKRGIHVRKQKTRPPFRHWGLFIAAASLVLGATVHFGFMFFGLIVAIIVQAVRKE